MHLAMAVGTGTIEDEPRLGRLGGGRMAGLDVTLLTKSWLEDLEERFMVRAVGVVAVRAALQHRRVLPQKGAPLLRVAGIAVVIDGVTLEELFGDCTVGVMTACAGHLALPQRHMGGAHELCPALEVALPAGLDFGGLRKLAALGDIRHDLMARGAGQVS